MLSRYLEVTLGFIITWQSNSFMERVIKQINCTQIHEMRLEFRVTKGGGTIYLEYLNIYRLLE